MNVDVIISSQRGYRHKALKAVLKILNFKGKNEKPLYLAQIVYGTKLTVNFWRFNEYRMVA